MHDGNVAISCLWVNLIDFNALVICVFGFLRGISNAKFGWVNGRFPLFHHYRIIIKARIIILQNECVLQFH